MGNGRFDRYSVTIDTPIDNNTNFLANDINGDGLTDILKCSDDTLTAYINKKGYISESIGFDYGLPVKYSIPIAVDINTRNSFSQVVCLKTDEVYKLTWNTDERIETLLSGLVGSLGPSPGHITPARTNLTPSMRSRYTCQHVTRRFHM